MFLGLHPDPDPALTGLGGAAPYWGVTDATAARDRLLGLGARSVSPLQDVGEGIEVAVLENPRFKLPD